jgi:hypothetical protein
MSYVSALIRVENEGERRDGRRHPSKVVAVVRQRRRHNDIVHLCDVSAHGCGFRSAWSLTAGTEVWLALPDLETWPAIVAWFEDGKGGLTFEVPLPPTVAARLAASSSE